MDKLGEGWKLTDIRTYVDEQWHDVGDPTDTPWPPEGI